MRAFVLKAFLLMAPMALSQSATPEQRSEVAMAPTTEPYSLAISPDGKKIVSVGLSEGRNRLWLRSLDSDEPGRFLPGTEDVATPYLFWSPDSRSIGFFLNNQLKSIGIQSGSAPETVAPNVLVSGGTWNRAGTILFGTVGQSIRSVSAAGGGLTTVTAPLAPPRQTSHLFPYFLPDGIHFLYYVAGSKNDQGIWVGNLRNSRDTKRLIEGATSAGAVYSTSGQILFIRQGTLFAQEFDSEKLKLSGKPFPVTDRVTAVSASASESIAYRSGLATQVTSGTIDETLTIKVDVTEFLGKQFTWFDRSGKEIRKVGGPTSVALGAPSLSPDKSRLLFDLPVGGKTGLTLMDIASGELSLFNSEGSFPVWSPDGRRIAFSSNRTGTFQMYVQSTAAGARDTLLMNPPTPHWRIPVDWSRDGRYLLYHRIGPNAFDIGALQLDGFREIKVASSTATCYCTQFSPDGKWVAYQSKESGRDEIYLQAFPPNGRPYSRLSPQGGAWPRWGADGKELFYLTPEGSLAALSLNFPDDQSVRVTSSTVLFKPPVVVGGSSNYAQQYVASADGNEFLVVAFHPVEMPVHLITNWRGKPE